ncbi:E3 ubiquitin-protein ligase RAD18 isoform X1 [Solea senegalensis]|uniref:RING-type E3 ubiquitin transferase n=1 Tax=Solea senegalensis TaxID=28829 RepID=A0AAV6QJE1_SOLSE|nr:E3 ubiquitin-protein ligase RAD18 [Solea senegalensis]KAG7493223.1 E3 ubiquitin-protein ligase RAD18 isoform X1 [Solea senegalensis]
MTFQNEADLPPGLECLKNVDNLLRCPICFDHLDISMMTKCSHNFCSLCIRKFLSYKLLCPVCNSELTEQDLRNNRVLDELVANFQAARLRLSKVHFDSPPISPKTPASAVKCKTPRAKGQKCSTSNLSHFFQKRTKTSPTSENQQDGSVSQCSEQGKMRTARTCGANGSDLHLANTSVPVAVKEEPTDVQVQGLMSVKREDAVLCSISTGVEMPHSSAPSHDVKSVIKVECPVCSVGVSQQFINKHLDTCLSSGEKKESLRSSLSKARRPMSKLVYNLLSTVELKRRLKESYLSVQGSRDQMIKRHKEFVHIYNAQCDSLNPKSAEDIAKEVEANEKSRNQLQGKAKPVMVFTKKQTEKEIEEIHSNYRKQHSNDFSRLIAQVRGRLETTRQLRIKKEVIVKEEDVEKTLSADQDSGSRSCLQMKAEDTVGEEEQSARGIELPPSPTNSDVSISSSISDIFGPEPVIKHQDTASTSAQNRKSSFRGDNSGSSPVRGKRRRKT